MPSFLLILQKNGNQVRVCFFSTTSISSNFRWRIFAVRILFPLEIGLHAVIERYAAEPQLIHSYGRGTGRTIPCTAVNIRRESLKKHFSYCKPATCRVLWSIYEPFFFLIRRSHFLVLVVVHTLTTTYSSTWMDGEPTPNSVYACHCMVPWRVTRWLTSFLEQNPRWLQFRSM